ncbi:hypothetical protein Tco_1114315 [Tanacetum coccineum]|uniref:Uncharacterized protein n=1 Tax=Tanacetum coccineum TaxID=301880 RepID=A0ABQ5IWZ0_9ASTR
MRLKKKDDDGDADDEDEDDDHISDIQDTNDEDAKTESDTNKFGNEEGEMHMEDDAQKETAKEDKGDEGLQATIKPVTLKEMPVNPLKSSGQSINSMMDVLVPQDTPCLQSPSVLIVLVSLRVTQLEKDVSELKKIDHSAKALASIKHTTDLIQKHLVKLAPETNKIQTPTIDLEQESEKCASEIRKIKKERAEKQKMLKYTIKSTDKADLRVD